MATTQLSRITLKQFASTAGAVVGGVIQFGSFAAGGAVYTMDPTTVQGLGAWLAGWSAAILGQDSPNIEDMNAVLFVFGYMLAYSMQSGIPEYDAGTNYFIGSLCRSGGLVYYSIFGTAPGTSNLGQALTNPTYWRIHQQSSQARAVAGSEQCTTADGTILAGPPAAMTETLPALATSRGARITVVNESAFLVTVAGNAAENILQGGGAANTFTGLINLGDSQTFYNADGTQWVLV